MGVEVLPPRLERGEPKPSASDSRCRYIRKYRELAPPHFHSPIVILCCEMRSAVSTVTRCKSSRFPRHTLFVVTSVLRGRVNRSGGVPVPNVEHVPQWKKAPWNSCQIASDCANACYMIDQWLLLEDMWLVYHPYK